MKVWKRCLSVVLAFVIFTTSVNVSEAAGTYDKDNYTWKATDAEVVGGHYDLQDADHEKNVQNLLANGAIKAGNQYVLNAPYPNGTEGNEDLFAIDFDMKRIVMKNLYTEGNVWKPISAELIPMNNPAEETEELVCKEEVCYFNNVEYDANAAFTYSGNEFKVFVTYAVEITIPAEEQERILNIPVILGQTAKNMDDFRVLEGDLNDLEQIIPYLSQLLTYETKKEVIVKDEITGEERTETISEPVFNLDEEEHKEAAEAIQKLIEEYNANEQLLLSKRYEEYAASNAGVLTYAMEQGSNLLAESIDLYETVYVIRHSVAVRNAINQLYTDGSDLYAYVKNLRNILRTMIDGTKNPGELACLHNSDNWAILDKEVQSSIFADEYTKEEFADLEQAAMKLRNAELVLPTEYDSVLIGEQVKLSDQVCFHQINVTLQAQYYDEEGEIQSLSAADSFSVLTGTTEAELMALIYDNLEQDTLIQWNEQYPYAQISTANYDRSVNYQAVAKTLGRNRLKGGIVDQDYNLEISYSPMEYEIRTNYGENRTFKMGYGSYLDFPISDDPDVSYEYIVETETGTNTYDEGVRYIITESVKITQNAGKQKIEYRLYDFLLEDPQYDLQSDENLKQIYSSSALVSPTLKIRKPGKTNVEEVEFQDGIYTMKANNYSAGIFGMEWIPQTAYLMKEGRILETISFQNGEVSWTNGDYTHLKVTYSLNITKVSNGIFNRTLDETEDILYALNLPYEFVTFTKEQNQLLSSTTGTSARTLYKDLASVNQFMGYLNIVESSMTTTEGKNAVNKILTEGWNDSTKELVLYTCLKACDSTGWSLASYYKTGNYKTVKEQTALLTECMEAILADSGFVNLINTFGMGSKLEEMKTLLPKLEAFSDALKEPHKAFDVQDEGFGNLINHLLSFTKEPAEVTTSNGIYAYETFNIIDDNTGIMTVKIQIGNQSATPLELIFPTVDGVHQLTEEEISKIADYIANTKEDYGITPEEEQYYDLMSTGLPKVGDVISDNYTVSLVYKPKVYTVAILNDMTDKKADQGWNYRFTYSSSKTEFEIILPPYSKDVKEEYFYRYVIEDMDYIDVKNGTYGSSLMVPKDQLIERFVGGMYYIEERRVMSPQVTMELRIDDTNPTVKGGWFDNSKHILYLDVDPAGVEKNVLPQLLKFYSDGMFPVSDDSIRYEFRNRDMDSQHLVGTGSSVTITVINREGEPEDITFKIAVLGDVNKDGKTDDRDMLILAKNYLGTASESELIYDTVTKCATDLNNNSKIMDSNDAWLVLQKSNDWEGFTSQWSIGRQETN